MIVSCKEDSIKVRLQILNVNKPVIQLSHPEPVIHMETTESQELMFEDQQYVSESPHTKGVCQLDVNKNGFHEGFNY